MSSAEVRASGAWAALCRAADVWEASQIKNREFKVKKKTQGDYIPKVSSEIREEYAVEVTEQAGRYMDAGHAEQDADRLALDDLGCVEFWGYMKERKSIFTCKCGEQFDREVWHCDFCDHHWLMEADKRCHSCHHEDLTPSSATDKPPAAAA